MRAEKGRRHAEEMASYEKQRADEAVSTLAAVPSGMFGELVNCASAGSFVVRLRAVLAELKWSERIARFATIEAEPLKVRTVKSDDSDLFIVTKNSTESLELLREGDPFVLTELGITGRAIAC